MGRILCPLLTSGRTEANCFARPRLSSKLYSRVRFQISPDKNVICPHPSARSTCINSSGSVSLSAASSPAMSASIEFLFVTWWVLARRCPATYNPLAYRSSSQASSPRFVASPQLPSPRTDFYELSIWYHDSRGSNRNKVQGTFTPQDHAHAGRTATEAAS